jgi:hypothetical protein
MPICRSCWAAYRAPSRQLRHAASDEPLDLRVANATGSAALDTIGNRIRGYRPHCSIIGRIGTARKMPDEPCASHTIRLHPGG